MRLVEAVATEALQVLPQLPGIGGSETIADTLCDEFISESFQFFLVVGTDGLQESSSYQISLGETAAGDEGDRLHHVLLVEKQSLLVAQ